MQHLHDTQPATPQCLTHEFPSAGLGTSALRELSQWSTPERIEAALRSAGVGNSASWGRRLHTVAAACTEDRVKACTVAAKRALAALRWWRR